MRTGLRVLFDGATYRLDLTVAVSGFQTSIQNFLTCLVTERGSDVAFPDKGTALKAGQAQAVLSGDDAVAQEMSLAAGETQFFCATFDAASELPDAVADVTLTPVSVGRQSVTADIVFTSYDGRTTEPFQANL